MIAAKAMTPKEVAHSDLILEHKGDENVSDS